MKYDYITIEPDHECEGEVNVYGHGTHERTSVLAGQPSKVFLDGGYPEDMIAKYPKADVLGHNTFIENHVPDCPPSDFDPADAGERWDDDY